MAYPEIVLLILHFPEVNWLDISHCLIQLQALICISPRYCLECNIDPNIGVVCIIVNEYKGLRTRQRLSMNINTEV